MSLQHQKNLDQKSLDQKSLAQKTLEDIIKKQQITPRPIRKQSQRLVPSPVSITPKSAKKAPVLPSNKQQAEPKKENGLADTLLNLLSMFFKAGSNPLNMQQNMHQLGLVIVQWFVQMLTNLFKGFFGKDEQKKAKIDEMAGDAAKFLGGFIVPPQTTAAPGTAPVTAEAVNPDNITSIEKAKSYTPAHSARKEHEEEQVDNKPTENQKRKHSHS